jgi:hypothetical protein
MDKNQKFKNFLESLKGKENDELIETVKTGFQACYENEDIESANAVLAKNLEHAPVKIKEYEAGGEKIQLPFWNPVGKVDKENCEEIIKASEGFYSRFEASEGLSVTTDARIKSAMYKATQKYTGFFSDDAWQAIHTLMRELEAILPDLKLVESKYDNKMPNESKEWIMVGKFQTPKGIERACWVRIVAAGAGSVDDPLEKYDITAQIEIASPKIIARYEALELISDNDPRLSAENIKQTLNDSHENPEQVRYISHTMRDKEGYDVWGHKNPASKLKLIDVEVREDMIHSTDPKLNRMNVKNHWLFAFDGKQFVVWAN